MGGTSCALAVGNARRACPEPPGWRKMEGRMSASSPKRVFSALVPILAGTAGVLSMVLITQLLDSGVLPIWSVWDNSDVNFTFTLQMLMLPVSFAAVVFVYFYDPQACKTFLTVRFDRTDTRARDWLVLGPLLAIVFTLGTTMYMSVSVGSQGGQMNGTFLGLLPFVLLFATTNAWTEEIFTRFVIVAGLHGKLSPVAVCWVSALVFGLPHFFGTPSGITGVITAGLMGWLLAKSVLETRSMTWALLIHFLQDVVIFGGGAMVIAGQA